MRNIRVGLMVAKPKNEQKNEGESGTRKVIANRETLGHQAD